MKLSNKTKFILKGILFYITVVYGFCYMLLICCLIERWWLLTAAIATIIFVALWLLCKKFISKDELDSFTFSEFFDDMEHLD